MSGVYIKGIDIPKSCWACTFFDSDGFCVIDGLSRDAEEKTNCPLIPVPDHGRLIDADEYRNEFMNAVYDELNDDSDWNRANRIIDAFDDAPTIIPASKEADT